MYISWLQYNHFFSSLYFCLYPFLQGMNIELQLVKVNPMQVEGCGPWIDQIIQNNNNNEAVGRYMPCNDRVDGLRRTIIFMLNFIKVGDLKASKSSTGRQSATLSKIW